VNDNYGSGLRLGVSNSLRALAASILLALLGYGSDAVLQLSAQPRAPETWKNERVVKGHIGNVQSLAFSPDSRVVAVGDSSGGVRIWEVATGKERLVLRSQKRSITSLAFSPKGSVLATGIIGSGDSSVRLWQVANGFEQAGIQGPESSVGCIAFSPDGKFIAAGGSSGYTGAVAATYAVKVWDVSTETKTFELNGFNGLGRVVFLPDSRTLVVARANGKVEFWDVIAGKRKREFQTSGDSVCGLGPQGKLLVVRSGFHVTGRVQVAGIGPDEKTLKSADAKKIVLYDLESGKPRRSFNLGTAVQFDSLSGDGRILLAAGFDGPEAGRNPIIRWWDVSTGKQLGRFSGLLDGPISALSLSADGKSLAVGRGVTLSLWSLK
jgi:WD40 repeat protein